MESLEQAVQRAKNAEFLSKYLNTCLSTHKSCSKDWHGKPRGSAHLPRLPTRVLQVGSQANGPIRIVEQPLDPKLSRLGRYTALSHCWGPVEKHSLTTTTDNLDEHRQGIPFDHLSRTFQDAVTITREIGVEYLWIDSLCILQNDRSDWEQEAPRMGAVYEEAYLTICATGAANGTEGCFAVAEELCEPQAGIIPLKRQFLDSRKSDVWWSYPTQTIRNDMLGPLQSRAWITQEWILSPRQIHYCRGRLAWCCDECQVYNDGSRMMLDTMLRNNEFADVVAWPKITRVKMAWEDIVQEYSERDLTVTSDKLAAILGLIRKIEDKYGENACLYGVLSEALPKSLAWCRWDHGGGGREQFLQRPLELQALGIPSWSWASTLGRINYARVLFLPGHNTSVCTCEYQSRYGTLILRSKDAQRVTTLSTKLGSCQYEVILLDEGEVKDLRRDAVSQKEGARRHEEYLVIPIVRDPSTSSPDNAFLILHCLLARPSAHRANVFERIGMAWFVGHANRDWKRGRKTWGDRPIHLV